MGIEILTTTQIINGVFSLIWVAIAIIVGLRIILKAFKLKRNELIPIGLSYILACSAWWGSVAQFISITFFDTKLSDVQYLFIANFVLPFAPICFVYSVCTVFYKEAKQKAVLFTVIYCLLWETFLMVSLFSGNIKLIGKLEIDAGEEVSISSTYNSFYLMFIIGAIIIFLISGSLFSRKSIKSDNPEIRWKGRFLLFAWILFTIGSLFDALPANEVVLIVVRLMLILSAIFYYLGFFLPRALANKLIKENR